MEIFVLSDGMSDLPSVSDAYFLVARVKGLEWNVSTLRAGQQLDMAARSQ